MLGIILCTHSELAEGLNKAVTMIAGEQENFDVFCFMNGDSIDDLKDNIERCAKKYSESNIPFCYVVDLYGATPFNVSLTVSSIINAPILTGANLPMLLELLMTRDNFEQENLYGDLETAMSSVKESMQVIDINKLLGEN